jgi:hypothetical protein
VFKAFFSEEKKQKTFISAQAHPAVVMRKRRVCVGQCTFHGAACFSGLQTAIVSRPSPVSPNEAKRHKSLLVLFFRKEHAF